MIDRMRSALPGSSFGSPAQDIQLTLGKIRISFLPECRVLLGVRRGGMIFLNIDVLKTKTAL